MGTDGAPASWCGAHGQHLLLCLHFKPFIEPDSFLTQNSSAKRISELVSVFLPGTSFPLPPHPCLQPLPPALDCNPLPTPAAVKVKRFLHGEAPVHSSNFTLEWSWAEHANPDITKQIKSRGWAQRGGWVVRLLGQKGGGRGGGGRHLSTWAALCWLWSGHPRRRLSNWHRRERRAGG